MAETRSAQVEKLRPGRLRRKRRGTTYGQKQTRRGFLTTEHQKGKKNDVWIEEHAPSSSSSSSSSTYSPALGEGIKRSGMITSSSSSSSSRRLRRQAYLHRGHHHRPPNLKCCGSGAHCIAIQHLACST